MLRAQLQRGAAFLSVAFTGLATQALTAISGPLVARLLGVEGRGEMVTVGVVALMAAQLGVGGLPMAIAHTVGRHGRPARDVVRPQLRRWLAVSLATAAAAAVVAAVLLRDAPAGWPGLSALAFAMTLVTIWQLVVAAMLQGEGNVRRINVCRLAGLAIYAATVAVMFVWLPSSDPRVIMCFYVGSMVVALALGVAMLRPAENVDVPAGVAELREFARLSYVSGVGLLDGLGLDLLLIGVLLGNAALGLYQVAYSATNLAQIVLVGVSQVLLPRLAAAGTAADRAAATRNWLAASVAFTAAVVMGFEIVVGPLLRFAFGPQFTPMIGCARILVVAWAFMGLRRVLTSIVQNQGGAGYASRVEAATLVLLLAAVAALGEAFGIRGAAVAVLGTAVINCALLVARIDWRPAASPLQKEPVPSAVS